MPRKRCSADGCETYARSCSSVCVKHGAIVKQKRCSADGCKNGARRSGKCTRHGAKQKRCSTDGCKNQTQRGGKCTRHHPDYVLLERISRGAFTVLSYLERVKISYETEKRFDDCRNKNPLPFDFYLPDHNLLIEYDGIQHTQPVEFWGGQLGFEYRQQCDAIKNKYAYDNDIPLLRISHTVRYSYIPFLINRIIIEHSI